MKKKKKSSKSKRSVRQKLDDGSGMEINRDPVMERLGEIINQVREGGREGMNSEGGMICSCSRPDSHTSLPPSLPPSLAGTL